MLLGNQLDINIRSSRSCIRATKMKLLSFLAYCSFSRFVSRSQRHRNVRKLKTIFILITLSFMLYAFQTVWFYPVRSSEHVKTTQEMLARLAGVPKENLQIPKETSKDGHHKSENESQTRCPYGYFRLPGMVLCHPWLNCSNFDKDILSVQVVKKSYSFAKKFYLGLWKEHKVVISTIKPSHFKYASVDAMKEFQPSQHIVQLVGSCNHTYITQYHQYGDARALDKVFLLPNRMSKNNLRTRLQICVSYIEVINFLHTRPGGPRVFCDSPYLKHTLTQFLITDDLHLVLNDLDYLYHANSKENKTTNCQPIIYPEFFNPPESFTKPRTMDERSDVWKIPDVCDYFTGNWTTSLILHELSSIKSRCREKNPSRRPTSGEVLSTYKHVLFEVMKHA